MTCERIVCVEYHRSGTLIWTDGVQHMPPGKHDAEQIAGIIRRTRENTRSTHR